MKLFLLLPVCTIMYDNAIMVQTGYGFLLSLTRARNLHHFCHRVHCTCLPANRELSLNTPLAGSGLAGLMGSPGLGRCPTLPLKKRLRDGSMLLIKKWPRSAASAGLLRSHYQIHRSLSSLPQPAPQPPVGHQTLPLLLALLLPPPMPLLLMAPAPAPTPLLQLSLHPQSL